MTKNHDCSLLGKMNIIPEVTLMKLNAGASIGDNYLAGKVLIESSSKVVFDGDSKKYTAFRHGMNGVIGIYGSQFSLIFDILQSRCSGKALEAIRCCDRIADPEVAVKTALDKLARYFGSSSQIIEAHISFITRADPVRWTVEAFQTLINELEEVKILVDTEHLTMLNSPGVVKKIIGKLPKTTREKLAQKLCEEGQSLPKFSYLLDFVESQLDLVSHPLVQYEQSCAKVKRNEAVPGYKSVKYSKVSTITTNMQHTNEFNNCPVAGCSQKQPHNLWKCDKFGLLQNSGKWAIAKKNRCCYKCLGTGHRQSSCTFAHCCKNCKSSKHHTILCQENQSSRDSRTNGEGQFNMDRNEEDKELVKAHNAIVGGNKKLLPVIPVVVTNQRSVKSATVNCLLDCGSDTTMCTKHLAKLLNAKHKKTVDVWLMTSNDDTKETGYIIDLLVRGVNEKQSHMLNDVICMDKVARHNNPIITEFFKLTKVVSFKELNIPVIKHDAVDLLIGSDFEELLDFTDVRRSSEYRVAAKLSIFGWLLVGNTAPRDGIDYNDEKRSCDSIHAHRAYLVEDKEAEVLTPCSGDLSSCKLLHEEIERYIAVDVSYQTDDEDTAPAINDLKCSDIYAKSIWKEGGRYFLDLPVKDN